ncbi:MAG: SDR family NAD(P)-dependent oxidoreductase [Clostridia bacterium]|nr:SDR family NAD(P)-dependent oxidoreductase [Clostridia bacterium]
MAYTFISGATGGIGKAFSINCAKKGYSLYLIGRSEQKLLELKEELLKINDVSIICHACDLSSESSRNKLLSDIAESGVVFDRIINVAGIDIQKPFSEYSTDKLISQMRVNNESTVVLTHELLSHRAEEVEVITISSMSGVSPMPYFALYSATKAMLTNLFVSLHYELKKSKVKVTVVLPGGVYTRPDIVEQIKEQGLWGKLSAKTPEFVAEKSLRAVSKNKLKYIPGFFNKFLNFIMSVLPKRIVLAFIARRWKNQTKDAF